VPKFRPPGRRIRWEAADAPNLRTDGTAKEDPRKNCWDSKAEITLRKKRREGKAETTLRKKR